MIVLHHCPQTRSMRSLWLLHELGVKFGVSIHPFDKTLRDPQYLSLSPAGRVPALEIEGERMFETAAITEYLCEIFPERGLGRPAGDMDRMAWLVWVHFAETVSQHTAALTQQHVMIYPPEARSPIVTRLEARRLEKCYAAIEARLNTPVERRDYLLTSGFSAADISVGQAIYMARHFVKIESFPKLHAWYDRITDRPSFVASLPQKGSEVLYKQDFYPPLED
ncbi:glutathione S-transferase family protein [Pseudogemmobacter sp. W21_MBD1_M6]|uniref:glutathione S-transferase family protein n=1 Tax=Pseudogemmobacter sp. W21_MBD1_M6 TaxID=3240271 RepID=UPI003F98EF43